MTGLKRRWYRVWVQVPVEVEALDDINAGQQGREELLNRLNASDRWAKQISVIDAATEIKEDGQWRPI
jgi:hypothetical protein